MTYAEAQAAELAMQSAIAAKPSKPRSAPKARFAAYAKRLCVNCGEPFSTHTIEQTGICANARS